MTNRDHIRNIYPKAEAIVRLLQNPKHFSRETQEMLRRFYASSGEELAYAWHDPSEPIPSDPVITYYVITKDKRFLEDEDILGTSVISYQKAWENAFRNIQEATFDALCGKATQHGISSEAH